MCNRSCLLFLIGMLFGFGQFAAASIVYDVPHGLTVQPNDDPRWNSTVQWAAGGGTIIAPNYFLTATHLDSSIGMVGSPVYLTTVDAAGHSNSYAYTAKSIQNIPNSDLTIVQINGTFTSTASIIPLYTGPAGSEVGMPVSFLGYGNFVQGNAVITGDTPNGWLWAGPTGDKNYGQNMITSIATGANGGPDGAPLLDYPFQKISGQDEAIYANRDSGGGTFINNGGVYQLAGVNYGVDQFFSSPSLSSAINGAIYDSTGLYVNIGTNTAPVFVTAASQGITDQHGYASEIAPFYSKIEGDIPEPTSIALGGLSAIGFMIFRRPRRCSLDAPAAA